jgi:hypothetical protein
VKRVPDHRSISTRRNPGAIKPSIRFFFRSMRAPTGRFLDMFGELYIP